MASKRGRRLRGHEWRTIALGVLVIVAMLLFRARHAPVLKWADLKGLDLRLANHHHAATGRVVVAAIDDKSIAALGRWPWPRTFEAQLVDALGYYKVKAAGFDIELSERDPADVARAKIIAHLKKLGLSQSRIDALHIEGNDLKLAGAIKRQGSTYLAYGFDLVQNASIAARIKKGYRTALLTPAPEEYNLVIKGPDATFPLDQAMAYLPPLPVLNLAARGTGFVNVTSDSDGVFRTEYMVVMFDGRACVPLSLELARAYDGDPPLRLYLSRRGVTGVKLGSEWIPTDEVGRLLLNFRGYEGTIRHYSVVDIIRHQVPAADLAGKIVLVGVTGQGLGDRVSTPVDNYYPGVELHATAVDNILRGDFISRSEYRSVFEEEAAAVVLGLAAVLATAFLSAELSAAIVVVMAIGYFAYAQFRLLVQGHYVGIVLPLVTIALVYMVLAGFRYFTEGREKRRLRQAFEHYLHPDIVSNVVDDPEGLRLGGQRRRLAVLFADVVGSTTLAEKMDPAALVEMLTAYMTEMIDIIMRNEGKVDKLMGDGIMAFWGAPQELANPSRAALDAAVAMLSRLREMRANDPRFQHFNIGVGIHTGEVTVGNFGGSQFFNYTAIGDPVNFASRLEGLTRKFKVNLLVSRDTLNEAGANYVVRDVGRVVVKGKEIAVPIAEVAGHLNDSVDPAFYAAFEHVVDLIRTGSFESARHELEELARSHPDDELIRLYLDKLGDSGAAARQESGELVFEFDAK